MEKIKGWILILFCSFILLIFALTFVIITPGLFRHDTNFSMSPIEIFSSLTGLIIVVSLCIYGLKRGLKKISNKNNINLIPFNGTLELKLNGIIGYKEYRNLVLGLTYKKSYYVFILGILCLFFLSFIQNMSQDFSQISGSLIMVPIVFILLPSLTLIQINKSYKTNKFLNEPLEFQITNNYLQITGQSFNTLLYWNHFHKMKETEKFWLFFPENYTMILLKKEMFSPNELKLFNEFVSSLNISKN